MAQVTLNSSAVFLHRTVTILCGLLLTACLSQSGALHTDASTVSNETLVNKELPGNEIPYQQRSIQDEVFYFVLPDRFANGDTSNDNGAPSGISSGGFDPSHAMSFHGGDVRGLQQKLPYLKALGITSIWLTPILRNQAKQGEITGYHGYWVLDFTQIDPHLGSNEDLENFINAAHDNNMKVFFDIITNHTADVIKFTECHGEDGSGWSESGSPCPYISLAEMADGKSYTTILPVGTENLKTPAWLNDPVHYHNQGDSTFEGENSLNGDFFGLDDLKTESPAVVDGMIEIYKNIITQFKPDGFRIDTVKHVNTEFWQAFSPALMAHAQALGIDNFFMFGEVYDFEPKRLGSFTTDAKLPSVLDFALQSALVDVFAKQQGTARFSAIFSQDHYYRDANQLLTFAGNHDMGRFGYYVNQQTQLTEEQKVAAMELAHAFLFFARGVPVIYYGDEQGFVGYGNDKGARQDMMPSKVAEDRDLPLLANTKTTADDNFDTTSYFFRAYADFAALYQQLPALRHGKQKVIMGESDGGTFAFTRSTNDSQLLVVFNAGLSSITKQLPTNTTNARYVKHAGELATLSANGIISMPAQSFAIFEIK